MRNLCSRLRRVQRLHFIDNDKRWESITGADGLDWTGQSLSKDWWIARTRSRSFTRLQKDCSFKAYGPHQGFTDKQSHKS